MARRTAAIQARLLLFFESTINALSTGAAVARPKPTLTATWCKWRFAMLFQMLGDDVRWILEAPHVKRGHRFVVSLALHQLVANF